MAASKKNSSRAAPKKKRAARSKAAKKPAKKPAKKAAAKAKAKGKETKATAPSGPRLSAAQQSIRDTLMLTRLGQGWTVSEAAAEAGISERQAKTAIKKKREALEQGESLLERDVVEIIEGLVEELRMSVGDFEKIASAAMEQNNLPVAVGAKKGADDTRDKLRELLQSVGALPHDLGTVTHLIDLRAVVVEINIAVEGFVSDVLKLDLPKAKKEQIDSAHGRLTKRLDAIATSPQSAHTNGGEEPDG